MEDSIGKKEVIPFVIAELEKSFIENQGSRGCTDSHYFRPGSSSQIPSACGPYAVFWFD